MNKGPRTRKDSPRKKRKEEYLSTIHYSRIGVTQNSQSQSSTNSFVDAKQHWERFILRDEILGKDSRNWKKYVIN